MRPTGRVGLSGCGCCCYQTALAVTLRHAGRSMVTQQPALFEQDRCWRARVTRRPVPRFWRCSGIEPCDSRTGTSERGKRVRPWRGPCRTVGSVSASRRLIRVQQKRRSGLCWLACGAGRALPSSTAGRELPRISTTVGRVVPGDRQAPTGGRHGASVDEQVSGEPQS